MQYSMINVLNTVNNLNIISWASSTTKVVTEAEEIGVGVGEDVEATEEEAEAEEVVEVGLLEVGLKSSSNLIDYLVCTSQEGHKIPWLQRIWFRARVCIMKNVLVFRTMDRRSSIEFGILSALKLLLQF